MKHYYTREEAIEVLGFKSTNAFLQLARKHPDVFANINQGTKRKTHPWYDKASVDRLCQLRELFKPKKQ